MTEIVVCPHCKHEYQPEDEVALSSTYSHGKLTCVFGCGREFSANQYKGNTRETSIVHQATDLKTKDHDNSSTLKVGKLSIGLNLKKKTMIITGVALIAFTILSFLYNEIGVQTIDKYILHKIFMANVSKKYLEILPEAMEQAKQNILRNYEWEQKNGSNIGIASALKKVKDGPGEKDIQITDAYREVTFSYFEEDKKYTNRFEASKTIGEWLKYLSFLTGALGLIFLLAGLLKPEKPS